MKNKKKTSKIMSVVSAVIAVFLLSTTVFASGVLSDLAADDYTIEILNNGEKIELENSPFIENDEVYVPLRETFEKVGFNEANSRIVWNDGKIRIAIVQDNGIAGLYGMEIGKTVLDLRHIRSEEINTATFSDELYLSIDASAPPILKGSVTYVSARDMDYMLYKFLEMRFSDNSFYELTYQVYDKNGNVIFADAQVIPTSPYENTTPEYTVDQFFQYFENGDFDNMKRYCTENCVGGFFGDGYCFGMTEAKLTNMEIEPSEYAKSSNDFVMSVSVSMTPYERSVYREGQTETAFYLILQRQSDGRYLIDEFATGL